MRAYGWKDEKMQGIAWAVAAKGKNTVSAATAARTSEVFYLIRDDISASVQMESRPARLEEAPAFPRKANQWKMAEYDVFLGGGARRLRSRSHLNKNLLL